MDKFWDRYPSKSVIGRCGVDEKNEWPRRTDKCWTLKKNLKNDCLVFSKIDHYCVWAKQNKKKAHTHMSKFQSFFILF